MSIIAGIYIRDGIIIASDTRKTITATYKDGHKEDTYQDMYSKTFLLKPLNIGISFFGNAEINGVNIHDFVKDNIREKIEKVDTVQTVVNKMEQLVDTAKTKVVICGYEEEIPYVICLHDNKVSRINEKEKGISYGPIFLGQTVAAWKLYNEIYRGKVNYDQMDLSEGIEILENVVKYAIENETMCGGNVDILVIKKDEADWYINKNAYQTVIIE